MCESISFIEGKGYIRCLKSDTPVLVVPIKHTLQTSHYIKLRVFQRFITCVWTDRINVNTILFRYRYVGVYTHLNNINAWNYNLHRVYKPTQSIYRIVLTCNNEMSTNKMKFFHIHFFLPDFSVVLLD